MPVFQLTRIDPDVRKGTDVFGNPNKKRSQKHGEQKGHATLSAVDLKVYSGPEEDNEDVQKQKITNVVEKVMGEKINVNESSKYPEMNIGGKIYIRKLKKKKGPRDVAADG